MMYLTYCRWDRKVESLSSTLNQTLPLVFPKTDSPPIPNSPPINIGLVYSFISVVDISIIYCSILLIIILLVFYFSCYLIFYFPFLRKDRFIPLIFLHLLII
jgi:hypothetical protein